MRGTRGVARRLAAAAMITGLALVVLASVAGADDLGSPTVESDVVATATGNATLKTAHVGSTNPGFGTGSCPSNTTNFPGTWGWHFVFQGSSTNFVTLTAVFDAPPHTDVVGGVDSNPGDNLTISGSEGTAFISSPSGKHAYVFTPGPD